MNLRSWPKFREYRLGRLSAAMAHFFEHLANALKSPAPESPQLIERERIAIMERDIVLPLKAAGIAMLLYSFYLTPWIGEPADALGVTVESIQYFFWVYILVNLVGAGLILALRRLPLTLIQWVVFTISLVDGIFLSALTVVSGGYESLLYWLFLGLIVRSAVSVPRATSQIMLNLTLIACFVLAGLIDIAVAQNLDEPSRIILRFSWSPDNTAQSMLLRLALLLLLTVCCYGVQVLLERQRRVEAEAREFAVREARLHSAGRMAAEFAHQIKNPLAIINNAAFSLQRALRAAKPDAAEQIRIIQEEVERSDRIITQIMGYAQLSEGRVEKLNLAQELNRAIAQVFPVAARYPVKIHQHYEGDFPPVLMLRQHLSDVLVNLLQNAREALDVQGGNVFVSAQCGRDSAIEVAIKDDGPGIPADKLERIFEAYYTTREKGTGLGLAIVKHNVELYGGSVRVESGLGKGTRFVLTFPARTPTNPVI